LAQQRKACSLYANNGSSSGPEQSITTWLVKRDRRFPALGCSGRHVAHNRASKNTNFIAKFGAFFMTTQLQLLYEYKRISYDFLTL
jgi:hypothetical protein